MVAVTQFSGQADAVFVMALILLLGLWVAGEMPGGAPIGRAALQVALWGRVDIYCQYQWLLLQCRKNPAKNPRKRAKTWPVSVSISKSRADFTKIPSKTSVSRAIR